MNHPQYPNRAALAILFVTLLMATVSLSFIAGAFQFDGRTPGNQAIITPTPDPRIEWRAWRVDGLTLCHPEPDSTGKHMCIDLPHGALLLIPRFTPDDTINISPRRKS